MLRITNKQAKLLEAYIRSTYRRNYIAVRSTDTPISMGDVLEKRHDDLALIDGSVFPASNIEFKEGEPKNDMYVSSSDTHLTFKATGEAAIPGKFLKGEAGLSVEFNKARQMFLLLRQIRQQSMKDFFAFQQTYFERLLEGKVPAKAHIVRGIVYAEQYFLQYSRKSGSNLLFSLNPGPGVSLKDASFNLKQGSQKGRHLDGTNGGVLAYRTSAIRFDRARLAEKYQRRIIGGERQEEIIAELKNSELEELVETKALVLTDSTEEVMIELQYT